MFFSCSDFEFFKYLSSSTCDATGFLPEPLKNWLPWYENFCPVDKKSLQRRLASTEAINHIENHWQDRQLRYRPSGANPQGQGALFSPSLPHTAIARMRVCILPVPYILSIYNNNL
jgi:hypothetical protein